MDNVITVILSVGVMAAFLVGGAGVYIVVKRPRERRKGLLMIAVGIVTLANVWLLSAPLP